MEEAALINDLIYRIELVSHRPVERLRPQCLTIERLNAMTNDLYQSVRSEDQVENSLNPIRPSRVSQTPDNNPSDSRVRRSRYVSADVVLTTAKISANFLGNLLEQEASLLKSPQLSKECDWRLAHLQPIFLLQKNGRSLRAKAEDRIFLLCSCLSLAKDFQSYETSLGQTSRHDISIRRILAGEDVAIQQNGKHFQGYLKTLTNQDVHKGKFDAGLRLGIKLGLIVCIGEELGVGSGLSLIAGYECGKLARMPYREIMQLFVLLKDDQADTFRTICTCCADLGPRWSNFHREYHLRYGASKPKALLEATSASERSVGIAQPAEDPPEPLCHHSGPTSDYLWPTASTTSSVFDSLIFSAKQSDDSWHVLDDILTSFPESEGQITANDNMSIDLLDFESLPLDLDPEVFQ